MSWNFTTVFFYISAVSSPPFLERGLHYFFFLGDTVTVLLQNNNLVVSGSLDGTAKLWNPNSGKCVGTLLAGKGQEG